MKPILRACLSARDTALRGGEVRQKRTWAVPAYGQEDTDWSGRARLDDSSWPSVATDITASRPQRLQWRRERCACP
jgi:hypothetical protein